MLPAIRLQLHSKLSTWPELDSDFLLPRLDGIRRLTRPVCPFLFLSLRCCSFAYVNRCFIIRGRLDIYKCYILFAPCNLSRCFFADRWLMLVADPPTDLRTAVKAEMPSLPSPGEVVSAPEAARTKKTGAKSSPYRGVTLFRPTMKWRAQVSSQQSKAFCSLMYVFICQATRTTRVLGRCCPKTFTCENLWNRLERKAVKVVDRMKFRWWATETRICLRCCLVADFCGGQDNKFG